METTIVRRSERGNKERKKEWLIEQVRVPAPNSAVPERNDNRAVLGRATKGLECGSRMLPSLTPRKRRQAATAKKTVSARHKPLPVTLQEQMQKNKVNIVASTYASGKLSFRYAKPTVDKPLASNDKRHYSTQPYFHSNQACRKRYFYWPPLV